MNKCVAHWDDDLALSNPSVVCDAGTGDRLCRDAVDASVFAGFLVGAR